MIYGYIYKITNRFDDKVYIGQTTKSVKSRIMSHIYYSKKSFCYFHNELTSYGITDYEGFLRVFDYEQIDIAYNQNDLDNKENHWIKYYDSDNEKYGYNKCKRIYCIEPISGTILKEYDSIKQASDMTGIKAKYISNVIRNIVECTGGYSWRYVHEVTFKQELAQLLNKHSFPKGSYTINGCVIDIN